MRQRKWTFYKVMLYLGLVAAVAIVILMCYAAFFQYRSFRHDTFVELILLLFSLQAIFYGLCIRLVHYCVPRRIRPGHSFRVFYIALLVFNSCVAIGSLYLVAIGASETVLKKYNQPTSADYFAFFIVCSYSFITIYLSAASVVLLRYNRYQVVTDEEQWLNQLGNPSLNS